MPWLATRMMPSADVPEINQPGALATRVKSPRSTGSGSSADRHTGSPGGSSRPAKPLAAQYGEPGPEYICRTGRNSPCQPIESVPSARRQPADRK